jgi:outer membrane protein
MKKQLTVLAAAATLVAPAMVLAQDTGDWIVRARALHLDSADKGISGLHLENRTFLEVDITRFLTPNLALELVLTYPQKHDLSLDGMGRIGSIKHLPPTLSVQYHVTGMPGFRPYVGAGVNYTRFSDLDLVVPASADKNSFGAAVGIGADIPLAGGWLVNVDLKKVRIRVEDLTVPALGGNLGTFKVDPVLFSIGIGKRF